MFAPVSNAEVLSDMKRFQLWVRLSATQSTHTIVFADNAIDAKLIGEVQFGKCNVLNYTEVLD
jgi:hypothetical protein